MVEKHFVCLNCGISFTNGRTDNHESKYCSRSCYHESRYGKIISCEYPSVRNPLCLEAIMTFKESAELTGIGRHIIRDWYSKYGAAITGESVCRHCGKSLAGMPRRGVRKY